MLFMRTCVSVLCVLIVVQILYSRMCNYHGYQLTKNITDPQTFFGMYSWHVLVANIGTVCKQVVNRQNTLVNLLHMISKYVSQYKQQNSVLMRVSKNVQYLFVGLVGIPLGFSLHFDAMQPNNGAWMCAALMSICHVTTFYLQWSKGFKYWSIQRASNANLQELSFTATCIQSGTVFNPNTPEIEYQCMAMLVIGWSRNLTAWYVPLVCAYSLGLNVVVPLYILVDRISSAVSNLLTWYTIYNGLLYAGGFGLFGMAVQTGRSVNPLEWVYECFQMLATTGESIARLFARNQITCSTACAACKHVALHTLQRLPWLRFMLASVHAVVCFYIFANEKPHAYCVLLAVYVLATRNIPESWLDKTHCYSRFSKAAKDQYVLLVLFVPVCMCVALHTKRNAVTVAVERELYFFFHCGWLVHNGTVDVFVLAVHIISMRWSGIHNECRSGFRQATMPAVPYTRRHITPYA